MVKSNLPRSSFPFMISGWGRGMGWVEAGTLVGSRRCNVTKCICEIFGDGEGDEFSIYKHTHTHTHIYIYMTD